jgi:asparagine synthetase B (glutamine-hydrolysing)
LLNEVSKLPPHPEVCLSNGVDSASVLLACVELNLEPTAVSFTLEGRASTDFTQARRLANRFDVPFRGLHLPVNPKVMREDVETLIRDFGCIRKAQIECSWPMLYLARTHMSDTLVTGHGVDSQFGLSRAAAMACRDEETAYELDMVRIENQRKPDAVQHVTLARIGERYDVRFVQPFFHESFWDLMRGTAWGHINCPREKEVLRRAFCDVHGVNPGRHSNLQLGDSGISKAFYGLLGLSECPETAKSPVAFYNHLVRQHEHRHRIRTLEVEV